jgi:hypothetical protein
VPQTRTVIAVALAGTIALGTLAGATIPTRMTSKDAEAEIALSAPPSLDGRDYYVEPTPQDLSPPQDMSTPPGGYAWDVYRPGAAAYDVQMSSPVDPYTYAYADESAALDGEVSAASYEPSAQTHAPAQGASSAEAQAAQAAEVAEEVREAEQAPSSSTL